MSEVLGDDLLVDSGNILGIGNYGNILGGKWKGNAVAVKRVNYSISRETEDLVRKFNHENVVKILHVERHDNDPVIKFSYCVFELGQVSLDQFFLDEDHQKKFRGPKLPKKNLLLQLAKGMEYILSKNFTFDVIKPNKVIISVDPDDHRKSTAKWSISGLLMGKRAQKRETVQLSEVESIWKAPEITMGRIEQFETVQSNVFAVGLVFAYILLSGKHLYDSDDQKIATNIKNDNPVNLHKIKMEHYRKLINGMILHDSSLRPTMKKVTQQIKSYVDYVEIRETDDLVIKVCEKIKLSQGGYSTVLYGTLTNKKESLKKSVAVKRIDANHVAIKEGNEDALKELDHPNVVHLFHATSDRNLRYFVLELCQASMDQLFLSDKDQRKYKGPRPQSKIKVLHQLADGLEYIHSKKLIHGNIKPSNALIWVGYDEGSANNEQVIMKWSDFGIGGNKEKASGKLTDVAKNWKAPELLEDSEENRDPKSDVFAQGLVFGYFLLNGKHPYGSSDPEIQNNIIDGNMVNIEGIVYERSRNLIKEMLIDNPNKRIDSVRVVEKLRNQQVEILPEKLWEARFATIFKGLWNDQSVAVRRIKHEDFNPHEGKAVKFFKEVNHENVIRLYHTEDDIKEKNRYFALELCVASLNQAFVDDNDPRKYRGRLPLKEDILLQLANGMKYIHDCGLVHLNAKPRNVLIYSTDDSESSVLMKWADFGLSPWLSDYFHSQRVSEHSNDMAWLAPELMDPLRLTLGYEDADLLEFILIETSFRERETSKGMKADVYSQGLVFVYVLLDGKYQGFPFDRQPRMSSEDFNNLIFSNRITGLQHYIPEIQQTWYHHLVREMLINEPAQRIDSTKVVEQLKDINCKVKVGDNFFVDDANILGTGSYGNVVYGTWNGNKVAIKRIQSPNREDLVPKLDHENVVKLLQVERDDTDPVTSYYVLELCQVSLDQFFLDDDHPKKFRGPKPPKKNLLRQLADGLEYIHFKGYILGDIKPKRVFLAVNFNDPKKSTAKWSISSLLVKKNRCWKRNCPLERGGKNLESA